MRDAANRFATVTLDVRDWLLLDLNRYLLALGPLAAGFTVFVWLEVGGFVDVARSTTPMLYLFSALAGGNITLITIVVSINQLVLSRELRSPRELQTEMEAASDYRDAVESETDRLVVPEEPREFLLLLARNTRRQVAALDDAASALEDTPAHADLEELAGNLGGELDGTLERLERSRGGVFPALSTVLDANFSTRINHIRWICRAYEADLPASTLDLLDGLEDRLEQLDVARQYYKTIYIKQELADVSKLVMLTGFVAILVAIVFIVYTGYHTSSLSAPGQLLLIPVSVTVNLVPLALLISHVLRIATVSRRTAAITPFLSHAE